MDQRQLERLIKLCPNDAVAWEELFLYGKRSNNEVALLNAAFGLQLKDRVKSEDDFNLLAITMYRTKREEFPSHLFSGGIRWRIGIDLMTGNPHKCTSDHLSNAMHQRYIKFGYTGQEQYELKPNWHRHIRRSLAADMVLSLVEYVEALSPLAAAQIMEVFSNHGNWLDLMKLRGRMPVLSIPHRQIIGNALAAVVYLFDESTRMEPLGQVYDCVSCIYPYLKNLEQTHIDWLLNYYTGQKATEGPLGFGIVEVKNPCGEVALKAVRLTI